MRYDNPDFYDLSIVMPFYKRLELFKKTFIQNSKFYKKNGIEIILVLDEPSEENDILKFIQSNFDFNWKIIINRKPHDWRNPAKAINVGIRNANYKNILVISPESIFENDIITELHKELVLSNNVFTFGNVAFVSNTNDKPINYYPYGSIMFQKRHAILISGYNENIVTWGAEDDNFRRRLNLIGIASRYVPNAKILHQDINKVNIKDRTNKTKKIPIAVLRETLYPIYGKWNNSWGNDFNEIIFDWKVDYFKSSIVNFCKSEFLEYNINWKLLNSSLKIICLVPCYNESSRILGFIKHHETMFDAFIFLDDESTDTTFELINHEKTLFRVKKKRYKFNDLENRNLLLKLLAFSKAEWGFFLDVDELIHQKTFNHNTFCNPTVLSMTVNLVHLWDEESIFRADVPESDKSNQIKGVLLRWRIFRNTGFCKIESDRELHFPSIPYISKSKKTSILILHYGSLNKIDRIRKYQFYATNDFNFNTGENYKYLIDESVEYIKVEQILSAPFSDTI